MNTDPTYYCQDDSQEQFNFSGGSSNNQCPAAPRAQEQLRETRPHQI